MGWAKLFNGIIPNWVFRIKVAKILEPHKNQHHSLSLPSQISHFPEHHFQCKRILSCRQNLKCVTAVYHSFTYLNIYLSPGIRLCTNTNKTKYLHLNFKLNFCLLWQRTCKGFPGGTVVKTPPANGGYARDIPKVRSLDQEDPLEWQPTPVFLTGKFHGQRSPVGYSPRGAQRV